MQIFLPVVAKPHLGQLDNIQPLPQSYIRNRVSLEETLRLRRGFVETECGQVHYRTAGTGPAIVLFHINQQSSLLYLELAWELAPNFTVFAMDYPSYGASDHVSETPGIAGYARCAADLLDQQGQSAAYVLGEAVGSAIATQFAVDYPERTLGLIMLNCPLMPSKEYAAAHIAGIRATQRPSDSSGFPLLRTVEEVLDNNPEHAPLQPNQSWMDRINISLALCGRDRWQASDALTKFDLRGALGHVSSPALLLTAEHSPFAAYREDVERTFPGITSEIIPNCRFGMGWERAAEIGARTAHFANEIATGSQR